MKWVNVNTSFFVFCLISCYLQAQNREVDSLMVLLETGTEDQKASVYLRLAAIDTRNNPRKKIDYGLQALEFANRNGQKEEIYHALGFIATGYAYLGNIAGALEYDLKAMEVAQEMKDPILIARSYNSLGYDYMHLGDYEQSLGYYLNSLDTLMQLQTLGEQKLERKIAIALTNISTVYFKMKQYLKSVEYGKEAFQLQQSVGDSSGMSSSANALGSSLMLLGRQEEALWYFQKALAIRRSLNIHQMIAETLVNIGKYYETKDRADRAYASFHEAMSLFDSIPYKTGSTNARINLARFFLNQGKPVPAWPYIQEAIRLATETGSKNNLSLAYTALADYYSLQGDYRNACLTQERLIALKDSLFSESLAEKVSVMQTKYDIETKEREIELLTRDNTIQELEIQQQRTYFYISTLGAILLLVLTGLAFLLYRMRQKSLRTSLEFRNLETEQRLLRSQINPHFIFNSLNSVQSYISGNNARKAISYLNKFAGLIRNILENSRQSMIPLEDEISMLSIYIDLEKLRMDDRFTCTITVASGILPKSTYIPPMLIQPFVENAIRHGFREKPNGGVLNIAISKDNELLLCVVTDNGTGRPASTLDRNTGHVSLGVQLTLERLKALSHRTKADCRFTVVDLMDKNGLPDGTQVEILIPFEEE